MTPRQIVDPQPILTHEHTVLYRRTRELHAFAIQLEHEIGKDSYFTTLRRYGFLAMMAVASAAAAPTVTGRARHLATVKDRIARFCAALDATTDRGLFDEETLDCLTLLTRAADEAVMSFEGEIRALRAKALATRAGTASTPSSTAPSAAASTPESASTTLVASDPDVVANENVEHAETESGTNEIAGEGSTNGRALSAPQQVEGKPSGPHRPANSNGNPKAAEPRMPERKKGRKNR